MKLNIAGFIAVIILLLVAMTSCTTSRSGCGTYRDVQRHDRKPFRAYVLKDGGTIAQALQGKRATLVYIKRTMRGFKHFFITDEGDTIKRYLYPRLQLDSCYIVEDI